MFLFFLSLQNIGKQNRKNNEKINHTDLPFTTLRPKLHKNDEVQKHIIFSRNPTQRNQGKVGQKLPSKLNYKINLPRTQKDTNADAD